MDPIAYLTTSDALFGWIEWIVFVAQIVLLLVGAFFAFVYRDANQVKWQALQRLGYALLVLGAFGTLLGGLKLGVVAPFDTRLWVGLILLFELALGIYAFIYSRSTYPEQVAAAARRTVRPSPTRKPVAPTTARKQTATNTPTPVEVDVTRVASGRRDARRDRKRKRR